MPTTLSEAAPKDAVADPLSGAEFLFRVLESDEFEIQSKGIRETGPVRLIGIQ